jgi:hypothetical protein
MYFAFILFNLHIFKANSVETPSAYPILKRVRRTVSGNYKWDYEWNARQRRAG